MTENQPDETGIVYLAIDDVLDLHGLIISATKRQAADQLRDRVGLESALGRPSAYAHYENADLALQASVLAHGIAEGQHFIDGNKRTGLIAMLTFLEINGMRIEATDIELAKWILDFSKGVPPETIAILIRGASKKTS